MGKPRDTQTKPKRKDGFFIKKTRGQLRNKSVTSSSSSAPSTSTAASGSFFVTPSEKREILRARETKRTWKTKPDKTESQAGTVKPKKEFDKKKWRLQRYSNKYKLEQWEEKRKKAVLHEYYRQIQDEPKVDVQQIYEKYKESDEEEESGNQEETENENNLNEDLNEPHQNVALPPKKRAFKRAHAEFERIREEKKQKKEDLKRKKLEKAEALKKYKENKLEKFKKLNRKTKKGQPIMKYRMEMLLEQIQKSVE